MAYMYRVLIVVLSTCVAIGGAVAPAASATAAKRAPSGAQADPRSAGSTVTPSTTSVFKSRGYWQVASDGTVYAFGDAHSYGSATALYLNHPIVEMAATPSGHGYWLTASDGGIFSYGDAHFFGSTGGRHLNRPIVGIHSTASGHGYWLVASDGGVFSFGDAHFFGSTGGRHLNRPIVGMEATPSGHGYWLLASDGGIFSFGDARFAGSTGAVRLNRAIVGMASTPSGHGYWLTASDGGIFSFGDARFAGSTGAVRLNRPVVGIATTSSGRGYWLVASDGGVFSFGDATFYRSLGFLRAQHPVVAMEPTPPTTSFGAATKLAFTTQPSDSSGGTAFGTQPAVRVQDAGGNTVVGNTSTVTLALATPGGATLACTGGLAKAAVAGVATFAGCAIDLAGTYTLTATDASLTAATSASITITVGAASRVAFTTEPSNSTGGSAFATQPVVTVQDAGGNTVVGNTSTVTLALATPGGATLACTGGLAKAAVAGVATFAGCNIDRASNRTITASDGVLTAAVSRLVTTTVGAAAKLGFSVQPIGSDVGGAFATQPVVAVQDLGGNTVTTDTSSVTLALTVAGGATLTCTANPQAAIAGVAVFALCSVDVAGTYTLTATDGSLALATSSSFTVTPGG